MPDLPQVIGPVEHTSSRHMDHPTLAYYEAHADDYARRTLDAGLYDVYPRFVNGLSTGSRILDLGCGAGRDLKVFARLGFRPYGLDASPSLVRIAGRFSGVPVVVGRIEDIEFDREFDAVWACASLLHVPRQELNSTIRRIRAALKPGGPFFASIQAGTGEERGSDGRLFTYFEENEFRSALVDNEFHHVEAWITGDSLREGRQLTWLNFLSI